MSGHRARRAAAKLGFEIATAQHARQSLDQARPASPPVVSSVAAMATEATVPPVDGITHIENILESIVLDPAIPLKFRNPPNASQCSVHLLPTFVPSLTSAPCNDRIATALATLGKQEVALKKRTFDPESDEALSTDILLTQIHDKQEEIRHFLRLMWERDRLVMKGQLVVYTDRFFARRRKLAAFSDALPWYLLLACMKILMKNSDANCNFVLSVVDGLKRNSISQPDTSIQVAGHPPRRKSTFPSKIGTIIDWLDISPPSTAYTCCSTCYAVYPPTSSRMPSHCTRMAKPDDENPCGTALYRATKSASPIRTMLYYGIANWLGDLLCRPEIEDAIDASRRCGGRSPARNAYVRDTWESPAVHDLLDPLTGKPFIDFDDDELHIIIRLSEDGFHPFGKRPGGKSISVGAVIIVCMNLPSALRERKDNICTLATIPGPGSPSLDQMNGPIGVVVDELDGLAHEGVFVTRTSRFPFGRKVRVLLLHTTGDQPAIRQLCGFSSATSTHFCPYCTLTYQKRNNIDYKSWMPRRWRKEKKYSIAYRDAKTEKKRLELVDRHGLRWSPLHALGHFDPFQMALPDASHMMACLFRHQIRGVYGMSTRIPDDPGLGKDENEPNITASEELCEAWLVLRRGDSAALDRLSPKAARRLFDDIKSKEPESFEQTGRWTKAKVARALREYRLSQGWFAQDTDGREISGPASPGPLLTAREIGDLKSLTSKGGAPSVKLSEADMTPDVAWEYFSRRNKTVIEKDLDRSALVALAQRCLVPDLAHPFEEASTKTLKASIHQARINADILDENGKVRAKQAGPRARPNPKAVAVLGKERTADLATLIHTMQRPSWLPKPTSKPGDPSEGSLKSSSLRRLAEVWLAVSLIRAWGPYPQGSRERRMLENYMHLVSASVLLHKRKTRQSIIRKYHREAHRYLETRAELFPSVSVTPYEHIMLHFSWFLERYGPMHSWQQLLMEQRNGDLQKIPTNFKFGELEQTMFNGFGQEQCLRVVLGEELPNIRPEFSSVTDAFSKRFAKDIHADLRDHHLPVDEHFQIDGHPAYWDDEEAAYLSTNSREYRLLCAWIDAHEGLSNEPERRVLRHKAITFLGQKFQVHGARTEGDTHMVYRDGRELAEEDEEGLHSTWTPAHILDIFSHNRLSDDVLVCKTFFVVRPYAELTALDARHDIFREFVHWGGRLYYNNPEQLRDPILVSASEVVCQLVSLPMNIIGVRAECLLVVPVEV